MSEQLGDVRDLVARLGQGDISIDDIVYLFDRIDSQILELHRCSSEDFLGLNAHFKGFYKETKGISASAGELFVLFSEGANRRLVGELADFHASVSESQSRLARMLEGCMSAGAAMRESLSGIYLPLRNMAQTVGTLGLLLTNLTLGHKRFLSESGYTIDSFNACRQEVDVLAEDFTPLGRSVRTYVGRLETAQQQGQLVRGKTRRSLEAVLNSLHFGLLLFAEKHAESHARIPDISQRTENTSKSIAGIITNLQYQDIIRQKMEHIQTAHQELMDSLRVEREHVQAGDTGWVEMLAQIRDISALQSAQLVVTNREYQSAIETLSQHFREIAQGMETIAELSRDTLRVDSEHGGDTAITDLFGRLKYAQGELSMLTRVVPEYHLTQQGLVRDGEVLCAEIEQALRRYEGIAHTLAPLLSMPRNGDRNESFTVIVNQIESVIRDMDVNVGKIGTHLANFSVRTQSLHESEVELSASLDSWHGFAEGVERMQGIGEELAKTSSKSLALLTEIEQMSKKVSQDTQAAMGEIRYYDLFEGVIGEIIDALNAISLRIREEVRSEVQSGSLENIRRHYTMASERRVHDAFDQSETGDVDLFGQETISDADVEEDDDGLELF